MMFQAVAALSASTGAIVSEIQEPVNIHARLLIAWENSRIR
jgi:hypothetical protein